MLDDEYNYHVLSSNETVQFLKFSVANRKKETN